MDQEYSSQVYAKASEFTSELNYDLKEVAVILAAGHGKRIKSNRSKMLHTIWGIPTVQRVYNACNSKNFEMNTVIVVGIKALDVIEVFGKRDKVAFAYQENQLGTGHAVQVGLEKINKEKFDGIIYVFPGDMGLIDSKTVNLFRESFKSSGSDMMVLTGQYEGDVSKNSYGRIVRVKDKDVKGVDSGEDFNKVIEIIEHKDILAIEPNTPYLTEYNEKKYSFSKKELIENREYNSGVYAFDSKKLYELVFSISSENAQKELYITDLIGIFNKAGYSVDAVSPEEEYVVMGFNDKTVLKEMEKLHQKIVYDKLKNIIEIEDPSDFFIDEEIVDEILELDALGIPLDIYIGKGTRIGRGVKINYGLNIRRGGNIYGNIIFGKNVKVSDRVWLSTFTHQTFKIGDDVQISWGDIIKGNITIGNGTKIESSVNMTGSDDFPLIIGSNVLIKGTSYLFGSVIEDDIQIEHSVIIKKTVRRQVRRDGTIQPLKFFLPMPSGLDIIEEIG